MKRTKISAMLVIYHEEKVLERCLKSLKGAVDEIIVIHDGECKDKSLEIAKKYTAKVKAMEHKGMGEMHYIDALGLCKGEWILKIDGDEYLSDELKIELRKLANSTEYNGFSFVWPFWDGEKYFDSDWPNKAALFRKSALKFIENYHTNFWVDGKVKSINMKLEHKPVYFNNSMREHFKKKNSKWIVLQAQRYLVPTNSKRSYNLNDKDLRNIEKRRLIAVRYPFVLWIMSFVNTIRELLIKPKLIFKRSLYFTLVEITKYNFRLANEISRQKKNG